MKMSEQSVMIFRLNSGEELVSEYKKIEGAYTLTYPALILPGGQGKIVLAPFMPYAEHEDGIDIPDRSILFCVVPHENLLDEYNDHFGKDADKPKLWQPDNKLVGVRPDDMPSAAPQGPVSGAETNLKITT
jgi:hypothetical protein